MNEELLLSNKAKGIPKQAVEAVLAATGQARQEWLEDWEMFWDHGIDYAEWMIRVTLATYDEYLQRQIQTKERNVEVSDQ
jgi:hypothetical protein